MAPREEVTDSPAGWVNDHIQRYVETEGEDGHEWQGVPTLLLTTRGRRSGKLRRTALIYGEEADRYLMVASKGGAADHPAWYLNLSENPEVWLQVGAEEFAARTRIASEEEKPELWELMAQIWPQYNDYQEKTDRDIPLVIAERI